MSTNPGNNLLVSILIPNWNGEAFLARCLAAALQSAAESGYQHEILLLDDASTDRSIAIADGFTAVKRTSRTRNVGFGTNVNLGVAEASGEIVVLLNNDLVCQPTMVKELVQPLVDNPRLFGVSGKTLSWESGEPNHLNMRGRWTDQGFKLTWSDEAEPATTMFLQGGSCSIRKEEFLEWGGFDPLYAPGYWEDYDISYQALKAGWELLYNPAAVGLHLGQGSMIRAHGSTRIDDAKWRNYWHFLLLNIHDPTLLWSAMTQLPGQIAFDPSRRLLDRLSRGRRLAKALPTILHKRGQRASRATVSDAEIAALFNHLGTLSD